MAQSPEISTELVRRLIAKQFPHWAELAIEPILPGGWDNRSFRLGDTMIARLPSAGSYVPQVEKEQRWLPRLAPQIPVAIPEPLALGQPDRGFPWPWSVYRWIEGQPATVGAIADLEDFAAALGNVLTALQRVDSSDGPAPGAHNFHRGGSLCIYDAQVRTALAKLSDSIDSDTATQIWDTALASQWDGPARWVHGDIAPGNLLVRDGKLAAIIDFGCCAVGDPACDLAIAWQFFEVGARDRFQGQFETDDACWARGCGWALWKALIVLAELPGTNPAERNGAAQTLDRILSEFGQRA